MTKSEIETHAHNYDQRIRAIVTAIDKLGGMEYSTERLTLSIMQREYQAKLDEINTLKE